MREGKEAEMLVGRRRSRGIDEAGILNEERSMWKSLMW